MNKDFSLLCSCICSAIAIFLYALLAFGVLLPLEYPHFGTDIYDAYFYRLIEGRFDLPMRILRYEGHYAVDGTGFTYHGVAPLLTRALLYPFVALNHFPSAAFSVWLWAVVGTATYHFTIVQVIRKYLGQTLGYTSIIWSCIIAISIWICAPGLLLSSNISLYHEPISIAYAAMAMAIYLMIRCIMFEMPIKRALIPLAILAGILIHSRPHLAVGLYTGIVLMIGLYLWKNSRYSFVSIVGSIFILGAFALSFMQLNVVRFGSSTEAHGQFGAQKNLKTVQHGTVFWGFETADNKRARTYSEHGMFHPWRILPNLAVYIFDNSSNDDFISSLHNKATEDISGYGRLEIPRIGMIFLWPMWLLIIPIGLYFGRPRLFGGVTSVPLLMTTSIAAALLLSFPAITLRYRFDLWPLIFAICILIIPGLVHRFNAKFLSNKWTLGICSLVLIGGTYVSVDIVESYVENFQTVPDSFFGEWDAEKCEELVIAQGFEKAHTPRYCISPEKVYSDDF